jgi:hypothetical protein
MEVCKSSTPLMVPTHTHPDSRAAGGETVYATMINFVLAMMQHPEAQRNAHDEIDSIVRNAFGPP